MWLAWRSRVNRLPAPIEAIAYFAACQAGWFICIVGAAHGSGLAGCIYTLMLALAHIGRARRPGREAYFVMAASSIGWLWESVLAHTGLLIYPNGVLIIGTAPYWMGALWALFAVQFNVLLRWLASRLWLAALLGAVGAPLSFRAGVALGAARIDAPLYAYTAIAFGWAVLMPALLLLSGRLDGITPRSPHIE